MSDPIVQGVIAGIISGVLVYSFTKRMEYYTSRLEKSPRVWFAVVPILFVASVVLVGYISLAIIEYEPTLSPADIIGYLFLIWCVWRILRYMTVIGPSRMAEAEDPADQSEITESGEISSTITKDSH